MKTETINLYDYSELTDEAKETAFGHFLNNGSDYCWSGEAMDTLKAFAKVFNLTIADYSIGTGSHSYVNFHLVEEFMEVEELTGPRLAAYLWNNFKNDIFKGKYYSVDANRVIKHNRVTCTAHKNGNVTVAYHSAIQLESCCPFTGVCFDEGILKPIIDFMNKPNDTTYLDLLTECIDAWTKEVVSDMEYQQSEEFFQEECEANERTFLTSGIEWN